MMDAYFPAALEAAMTPTCKRAALLRSVWLLLGEKSPHVLLITHQSGKTHNIYIEHTQKHTHTHDKSNGLDAKLALASVEKAQDIDIECADVTGLHTGG